MSTPEISGLGRLTESLIYAVKLFMSFAQIIRMLLLEPFPAGV